MNVLKDFHIQLHMFYILTYLIEKGDLDYILTLRNCINELKLLYLKKK